MENKKKYLLMLALVSFTAAAFAQKDAKKEADKQNEKKFEGRMDEEAEFMVKAADGGMFEVQAGKLANTNASSEKIKELANHMIMDHSRVNEELTQLASKKNISIPTKLSAKMQKKLDQLSKQKGADFDKEYAKEMVNDHKKDIEMFEKEADKGKDPEIKAWASEKLPTLKHHLSMAENTLESLNETVKK